MFFFLFSWVVIAGGALIHLAVEHRRHGLTANRVVELLLVWVLAAGGVFAIIGGLGHIGPNSTEIAEEIGFQQSMFQWELGWNDIAVGVLGLGCIRWRDGWLNAAAVALIISYGGDGIGHVMEYVAHDNDKVNNVWGIPSDLTQVLVVAVLLVLYRTRFKPEPAETA